MRFKRDAFEAGAVQSLLPKGVYQLEVSEFNYAINEDTGSEAYIIKYEIIDGEYTGRIVTKRQTLVNKDGQPNEIGNGQLNEDMARLSDGRFASGDFQVADDNVTVTNVQEVFNAFKGTVVQANVTQKDGNNGYPDTTVRIAKAVQVVYQAPTKQVDPSMIPPQQADLGKGSLVTFTENGHTYMGRIENEVGTPSDGMLLLSNITAQGNAPAPAQTSKAVSVADNNVMGLPPSQQPPTANVTLSAETQVAEQELPLEEPLTAPSWQVDMTVGRKGHSYKANIKVIDEMTETCTLHKLDNSGKEVSKIINVPLAELIA